MTIPSRRSDSTHRFSPKHQSLAARARHLRTQRERAAFERYLEQFWNKGAITGGDVRRFVSLVRRRIYRGDLVADYSVTPATLCDWLCGWRKALNRPGSAERISGQEAG